MRAIGSQLAITSGVWNGDDWATLRLALRAASAIWLAATTPEGKKKSGVPVAATLPAMSRLPTRVTFTGRRCSARILRTRSSWKKGSTSSAISPVISPAAATAFCSA